jgi:hypothetical protein
VKLIELPHKVCGMTCMINGLEDLYEQETGIRLPDWLLFYLSGMLGFVYVKNKNAPTPRMVFWGMQIAKYQYEALADVVGFQWQMVEGRSFRTSFARAKESIDQGTPALLGAVDMYHLPYYEKFYHKIQVPFHHVLMVGYDDAQEAILVLDCDRAEVQPIPYADLELAWNVHIPGMSKRNTFYTFRFNGQVADVETIAREGLRKHSAFMLDPPTSMFGIKGKRKLARELPKWPDELGSEQTDVCLRHLAEFTGVPPMPPFRLIGWAGDEPEDHTAGRVGFAGLLRQLARDYQVPAWDTAAVLFEQSGQVLESLTEMVVDYVLDNGDTLQPAAELVVQIADLEEQAFRLIDEAARG